MCSSIVPAPGQVWKFQWAGSSIEEIGSSLGKTEKTSLAAVQLQSHLMIQSLILTGELSHQSHVHSDTVVLFKSNFCKILPFVSFKPFFQQVELPSTDD